MGNRKARPVHSRHHLRQAALFVVLAIVWTPLRCAASASADGKRITVVFRYDDYANETTPADFDVKLIDAFRIHGVPATFAVIPFQRESSDGEAYYDLVPKKVLPLKPRKVELLVEGIRTGTLEVALHGYAHREVKPSRPWTEFAEVPLVEQQRRISEGKHSLEKQLGNEITVFVPPFNTYDENTIRVLEQLDFGIFSAGGMPAAQGASELNFLPATCERILDLREAVESARKSPEAAPVIVVMFHPHDFLEVSEQNGKLSLREFQKLLEWIHGQEDVEARTLSEVVADIDMELGLDHYRNYCAARPDKTNHLLPPFLRSGCSDVYFYPSPGALERIRLSSTIRGVLFYGAVAVAAFAIGYLVLLEFPLLISVTAYGSSVALLGLVVYVCRDAEFYYPGLSAIAGGAGICAAAWGCRFGRRRKVRQQLKTQIDTS